MPTKARPEREVIRGPEPPAFDGYVSAVKSGDLLFLSGLMAVEGGRLIDEAHVDERQPFYGIPIKAELRSIIRQAEAICRSAGTSLRNAVRIQQFHTDLADLPAAIEVWDEAMAHAPLPLSPTEVALAADSWSPRAGRSLGPCALLGTLLHPLAESGFNWVCIAGRHFTPLLRK